MLDQSAHNPGDGLGIAEKMEGWKQNHTSKEKERDIKEGNEPNASILPSPPKSLRAQPSPGSCAALSAEMRRLADRHPEFDFDYMLSGFSAEELEEQRSRATLYLETRFPKLRASKRPYNGYHLKHRAERLGDQYFGYVSEGALLLAAIQLGLEVVPRAVTSGHLGPVPTNQALALGKKARMGCVYRRDRSIS
jgi:hypothetical protein